MSSHAFPDDRSYTDDHEWVLIEPGATLPDEPVRVGITSVAVNSLGELVFVDLPESVRPSSPANRAARSSPRRPCPSCIRR